MEFMFGLTMTGTHGRQQPFGFERQCGGMKGGRRLAKCKTVQTQKLICL